MFCSRIWKEKGQNVFFTGNVAAFLNCCFYLPRKSWRFDFITCWKKFKKPCGPIFLCKLRWTILDKRRKDQSKVIFNWKNSFSSINCVSNNLLGVKRLILQRAPKAPKNLFQPGKTLFKVCHCRRHQKKEAKNFWFQRDDSLFFWKNLVLPTSIILTKWSYNFHKNCQKHLAEPHWVFLDDYDIPYYEEKRPKKSFLWK